VIRGWIGIVPADLNDVQARQLGLARGGVVVANLYNDSPAAAAGVRAGDIILQIDGNDAGSAQDSLRQLATHRPGTTVKLRLQRGTSQIDTTSRVSEPPNSGLVPKSS
jgi:serine protease Do